MEIRYIIEKCFLGHVIIGFTQKGICYLTFGDNENELIDDLKASFKNANIVKLKYNLEIVKKIIDYIENPNSKVDFTLDIYGTSFQKKVWHEISKIPFGNTITYKELAKRVGNEKAVRAVANACGANKIAVIIPCHRVIRSDGSLGGYSSGLWRKKLLLESESYGSSM